MSQVESFLKQPAPHDPRARAKVKARSQGACEARIAQVCTGRGVHVHHVRRRSQGGADVPSNLVMACSACHSHIHLNPAWAVEHGWLARTLPEPHSSAVLDVRPAVKVYDQEAERG